jgi:hypothetical protein
MFRLLMCHANDVRIVGIQDWFDPDQLGVRVVQGLVSKPMHHDSI